jgi:4-amino-4-deoxy-L-arabinose transferase-like glycosyltransferase
MNTNKLSSHHLFNKLFPGLFWAAFIFIILFLLLYELNNWPSVWWDEGWTLDAARNWITHGHLGHYLDGQPVAARSPVRFPVVVPVSLSMKIFGIGTWQGRLPEVILTVLSLGLTVYLCTKMFNRRIGIATIFLTLLLSIYVINPLVIGRQVMAEMPMMFYLFAGYSLLWLALTRSPAWCVGAALLFGVAIHAKLQVPPFWLFSISLAIIMSVFYRQRRSTTILIGVAFGSIVIAILVLLVQNWLMPGSLEDPALIKILFNSVIFVIAKSVRISALSQILVFGAPLVLAYIWTGWRTLRTSEISRGSAMAQRSTVETNKTILQTALGGLGASWFVWYAFMSLPTPRYMFPPFFIGCMFIAAYLDELTGGFDLRVFVQRFSDPLLRRKFTFINLQIFVMLIALCINLIAVIKLAQYGLTIQRYDPILASAYLRENIPAGARVETFESELFFLAPEVDYHFPSDFVSMQAQRKTSIDPQFPIDYDPLEAKPDYIVVGPIGHLWPIYDDVVKQEFSHLEADIGNYQIYHILSLHLLNNFIYERK